MGFRQQGLALRQNISDGLRAFKGVAEQIDPRRRQGFRFFRAVV